MARSGGNQCKECLFIRQCGDVVGMNVGSAVVGILGCDKHVQIIRNALRAFGKEHSLDVPEGRVYLNGRNLQELRQR